MVFGLFIDWSATAISPGNIFVFLSLLATDFCVAQRSAGWKSTAVKPNYFIMPKYQLFSRDVCVA